MIQNKSEEISDSTESEELIDVAAAIGRLSAAAIECNNQENYSDSVRDITDAAIRKTVEENEDLKRQIILLQQQLLEKDRRMKVLENLLLGEGKVVCHTAKDGKSVLNTATQVSCLNTATQVSCLNTATQVSCLKHIPTTVISFYNIVDGISLLGIIFHLLID